MSGLVGIRRRPSKRAPGSAPTARPTGPGRQQVGRSSERGERRGPGAARRTSCAGTRLPAAEPADPQVEVHGTVADGEVRRGTDVGAVDAARALPALRTAGASSRGVSGDEEPGRRGPLRGRVGSRGSKRGWWERPWHEQAGGPPRTHAAVLYALPITRSAEDPPNRVNSTTPISRSGAATSPGSLPGYALSTGRRPGRSRWITGASSSARRSTAGPTITASRWTSRGRANQPIIRTLNRSTGASETSA